MPSNKRFIHVSFDEQRSEDLLILICSVSDYYKFPEFNPSMDDLLAQIFKHFPKFKESYADIYLHYVKKQKVINEQEDKKSE